MTEYIITREFLADADSPVEAAQKALDIQRDPETPVIFKVRKDVSDGSDEILIVLKAQ